MIAWLVFFCALVFFVGLLYAEPILDSDIYFHLQYAKQMIERQTLFVDHTLYSWTPASNDLIYVSWLSEFVLYGVWSIAGLSGIFALRYLFIALVLGLIWLFARRCGLSRSPVTALLLTICALLIAAGTLPKPEIFTLVFFTATVFCYATMRKQASAGDSSRIIYAIPFLMILWVNSHGGFILAAPFFAATMLGEIALFLAHSQARLSRTYMRHMLAAWVMSAGAIFLTPYTSTYVLQLIRDYVFKRGARADVQWNTAYASILDGTISQYLVWLIVMVLVTCAIIVLMLRQEKREALGWMPLALATLAYVPLYVWYLRSTQFLPILFAFLVIAFCSRRQERAGFKDAAGHGIAAWPALAVAIFLMGFGVFETLLNPPKNGWIGFGNSTTIPVAEADFLARQKALGPNIYNVFDSGGYLLWKLYPQYKVMVDSRSFPYLSWFVDQFAFTTGSAFDTFIQKYPADIAVSDLAKREQWRNFLKSPDWRLAFYGPTAAVFVKANLLGAIQRQPADGDPQRFVGLRSAGGNIEVFEFATFYGDYAAADVVLRNIETGLRQQIESEFLAKAEAYRSAVLAAKDHRFPEALELYRKGLSERLVSDRDLAVVMLLTALVRSPEKLDAKSREQIISSLDQLLPNGFSARQ